MSQTRPKAARITMTEPTRSNNINSNHNHNHNNNNNNNEPPKTFRLGPERGFGGRFGGQEPQAGAAGHTHNHSRPAAAGGDVKKSREFHPNPKPSRFGAGGAGGGANANKNTRPADNWSQEDVKKWLVQNNIDPAFAKKLTPCSGADLRQLLEMKNIAPEFFYQSLYSLRNISELKPILKFSGCLENLPFKNKE